MTPVEAAYLAGLFDGEGCFRMDRFRRSGLLIGFQYRTVVEIGMCDKGTIEYVAGLTGRRRIEERIIPSGRTVYKLVWRNGFAADLIRQLLPYLRGKKEQATLCLHFEDHITPGRGRPYKADDFPRCEAVRVKLAALKRPIALGC